MLSTMSNERSSGTIQRRTVTVEEAAQILGIARRTAYTLANTGQLPVLRLGRRLLVPVPALEALLQDPRPEKAGHSRGDDR